MNLNEARSKLQESGRYMMENGLAWGSAGNISSRINPERCLISASGTNLGSLGMDDLVDCGLEGNENYGRWPSKELPMHAAIYKARPEIQAILHGSPFYATLVACADIELPENWFVEDMYYLERTARVPYFHPGSQELAEAVGKQAHEANVLLLENHGVLVYDTNLREALLALHTLEVVCRMVIQARSAGLSIKTLPPEVVSDFLQNSGYRPSRKWKEA